MAQLAQLSDLYPDMMPYLRGCDVLVAKQALERCLRQFTRDTEAWCEFIEPFISVDWQQDYNLTHYYTAEIHRIKGVWVNANEQDTDNYDLAIMRGTGTYTTPRLRFTTPATPNDQMDDRLLVCGDVGSSFNVIADAQAVTDGSVDITTDVDTYSVESLDFSVAADMDQVAMIIQTGWRDEADENVGHVRWFPTSTTTGKFVFYVESGSIENLTAGDSGTDISGANYLNGLSSATGMTLGPSIFVEVVFRAQRGCDNVPDWFFDRWGDTIAAGAMFDLLTQPGRPWTDIKLAGKYQLIYNTGWGDALSEMRSGSRFKHRAEGFSA